VTGSGIAVSADSLVSFLFISTYLCASLVLCLKLLPRLSRSGKRLASVMLAAQVIVIVMSLVTGPKGDFQAWLWSIGNEWTIESVLSSTQFALVGLVALLISWLDTAERPWRRLYIDRDRNAIPFPRARRIFRVKKLHTFLDLFLFLGWHIVCNDYTNRHRDITGTGAAMVDRSGIRRSNGRSGWHCL